MENYRKKRLHEYSFEMEVLKVFDLMRKQVEPEFFVQLTNRMLVFIPVFSVNTYFSEHDDGFVNS